MTDKEKQLVAAFQAIDAAVRVEAATGRKLSAQLVDCLLRIAVEAIEERRQEIHARDAGNEATFLDAVKHRDAAMWERKRWTDKVLTSFPEGIKRLRRAAELLEKQQRSASEP